MARPEFDKLSGHVIQTAYVVEDIRSAIDTWVRQYKTGPWFLAESFLSDGHTYRGEPSRADVSVAMAFTGSMNIELIQTRDDNPSIYREIISRRGFGFHHLGIAVAPEVFEAEVAAYEERGFMIASTVPSGQKLPMTYLDDGRNDPGFVELIPVASRINAFFSMMYDAADGWSGDHPIRPLR